MSIASAAPGCPPDAAAPAGAIGPAIRLIADASRQQTGGQWLESLTAEIAPAIKEWDIARCWRWADWPERETHFPNAARQDIGIDAVAVGRSDGRRIAIQCKARQLDAGGHGADVGKAELDKFAAASVNPLWAERWLVTNGDNRISGNARQVLAMSDPARPIKVVNIYADLIAQQNAAPTPEFCPHCAPPPPPPKPGKPGSACRTKRWPKACACSGNTPNPAAAACLKARPGAKSSCPAAPARRAYRYASLRN